MARPRNVQPEILRKSQYGHDVLCRDRREHILSASVYPQVGEAVCVAAPGLRIQGGKARRLSFLVWHPLRSHGGLWMLNKLWDAPCCLSVFRFGYFFCFFLRDTANFHILVPAVSLPQIQLLPKPFIRVTDSSVHPQKLWSLENNCYFPCIPTSCLAQKPGKEPKNAYSLLIRYCLKWTKISGISIQGVRLPTEALDSCIKNASVKYLCCQLLARESTQEVQQSHRTAFS